MEFNYDDICRHVGHIYLNSQMQLQLKDKEALALLQQNNALQEEVQILRKAVALKEQANDTGTQGTSG